MSAGEWGSDMAALGAYLVAAIWLLPLVIEWGARRRQHRAAERRAAEILQAREAFAEALARRQRQQQRRRGIEAIMQAGRGGR